MFQAAAHAGTRCSPSGWIRASLPLLCGRPSSEQSLGVARVPGLKPYLALFTPS